MAKMTDEQIQRLMLAADSIHAYVYGGDLAQIMILDSVDTLKSADAIQEERTEALETLAAGLRDGGIEWIE